MQSRIAVSLTVFAALVAAPVAAQQTTGIRRYDVALRKAITFLKQDAEQIAPRERSLVAYALFKGGERADSPLVRAGIEATVERAERGHDSEGYIHIYLSGVDAMLLADTDPDRHRASIQKIVDYVQYSQAQVGSWAGTPGPGDTSMGQYAMLALWAGVRAGCRVRAETVERAVQWHLENGNADGGWAYRPPSNQGSGTGSSTHNCTMAAAGSMGIGKLLLFGERRISSSTDQPSRRFGVLERVEEPDVQKDVRPAFPSWQPSVSRTTIESRIERAFNWATIRFRPQGHQHNQKQYFFYALERAAAIYDLDEVNAQDWFTAYGDVLLSLQSENGAFENTTTSPRIATSFAILYLVRSTQNILERDFGRGTMRGGRDLVALLSPDTDKRRRSLGPLDELLRAMENQAFASLEVNADEFVDKIEFGSREELIGQTDKLKMLLKNEDASNRRIAYWALGRTGDFDLIPLMLDGLRDPSMDVNVEALQALRYITRRPNGFGLTLDPLGSLPKDTDERQRVTEANKWRTRASRYWRQWYSGVRPYEQRDGLDEIGLPADEL